MSTESSLFSTNPGVGPGFINLFPKGRLNWLNLAEDANPISAYLVWVFFFKAPTKSSS